MSLYKFSSESTTSNLPLSSSLFTQLQTDILSGRIRSGEKLTEQKICEKYNVSRTPVREALRQLEMDGLVESIPNRGAHVIGFSEQDVSDIYQLRKIYEVQAVCWAIERITDEELDALEETFEFMEFYTMKKDSEKMLNINMHFHQLIYSAAKNRMLQHLLSSYQIYTKHIKKTSTKEDNLPVILEEHRAIFEAFKMRDVEAGAKAMAIHMDNTKARAQGK